MDLINIIKKTLSVFLFKNSSKEARQIIFLICLPCLVITLSALILANVSAYLISFILIILLLMVIFVVASIQTRAEYQLRTLANLIEAMIDGDYSLRGQTHSHKAFQELLVLVNTLAERLAQHKIEAKDSRQLLDIIMEQMDAMIFAVDENDIIVMSNQSAKNLLFSGGQLEEQKRLVSTYEGREIKKAKPGIIEFEQSQLYGEHFLLREFFLSEGRRHQLYLITSAERLLMEKERKAWQGLLRVLSHEMNNSLTPISSISQSMKKKLSGDKAALNVDSLKEGITIINERSTSLSTFISDYSQLSRLPSPCKTSFSIQPLIENITALFNECDVVFSSEFNSEKLLEIEADRGQIEQVLINLIKNANEAMENCEHKWIEVGFTMNHDKSQITIKDNGVGIANSSNLFVPFYSTKAQGSGIGLTLSKQIMFNHGGNIKLINRLDKHGAQAILTLPNKIH